MAVPAFPSTEIPQGKKDKLVITICYRGGYGRTEEGTIDPVAWAGCNFSTWSWDHESYQTEYEAAEAWYDDAVTDLDPSINPLVALYKAVRESYNRAQIAEPEF